MDPNKRARLRVKMLFLDVNVTVATVVTVNTFNLGVTSCTLSNDLTNTDGSITTPTLQVLKVL